MSKRESVTTTIAVCALAFTGCASQPALPATPALAPATSASAPAPSAEAPVAAGSASATASASAAPPAPPEPPAPVPDTRLALEPTYTPGAFPWPRDATERKAALADLERWNAGGVADGERWHAAPRVVIGEPSVASGKIGARDVMRVLRREQYWTVRSCYEPRLRESPRLEGRTVLRLVVAADGTVRTASVDARGRVPDARKHGRAMPDREVRDCLARSFRGIHVPAPRSKSATLLVSLDVWPGDAPLPSPDGPAGQGKLDLPRVDEAVATTRRALAACFERARRGAWGRLAVRLEVGTDGRVDDADEVETTFPDPDVTACVVEALRGIALPPPTGGGARAIVAFRWSAAR